MKKLILFCIAISFLSCKNKETVTIETIEIPDTIAASDTLKTNPENLLIVPGQSIGSVSIGENTDSLSSLGNPDFSDAAMGKAWLVWYDDKSNTKNRLASRMIYTTYKDNEMKEKVVSEIRVISENYKTETGLGVGSNFETVKKEFPEIKEFAKYRNQRTKKDIYIYDAPTSGIAFEFISYEGDSAICVAMIVYSKAKTLNTDYLLLLPERETPGGE